MVRFLFTKLFLLLSILSFGQTITVGSIEDFEKANKKAVPGNIIILKNGVWNDVALKITAKGTRQKPVIIKAQTPGKVIISGKSRLALGGENVTVDGLVFKNGFSGDDAVIEFMANKQTLANDCRVTNCVIDDFNNPKRLEENYWVAFYGKNNRLDHCSFLNKKNLGVLLAVILDDDRSRENFHSIDHNYFGKRIPLASNGGEIIRVGVSQHCQFNSNTQIIDNFFEHCDGETEIVSIKSGSNVVKNNLFKECQGGVVLRHGDNNTVENNIFLGNNKEGTGGVRVINKGQWVVNNFFYRCRGVGFRSPLSVMNGIPNSPANRYVQVTDAVIANNSFVECSPISLGEGSDAERTLPPANVLMINNIFYNTTDRKLANLFDKIDGIRFLGNEVNWFSHPAETEMQSFFVRSQDLVLEKQGNIEYPVTKVKGAVALPDSIRKISQQRLGRVLTTKPGFADLALLRKIEANAYKQCGAGWYKIVPELQWPPQKKIECATVQEIKNALNSQYTPNIYLSRKSYAFSEPLVIDKSVIIQANDNNPVYLTTEKMSSLFELGPKGRLILQNIYIDAQGVKAKHFISTGESGSAEQYYLMVSNLSISGLDRAKGCEDFFFANKSRTADMIYISSTIFTQNNADIFVMNQEKDDKGYYNAEHIIMVNNGFNNNNGKLIDIYRGGNDESTMGPAFDFTGNNINNSSTTGDDPLILLTGVQQSALFNNKFENSNKGKVAVRYKDRVRAVHRYRKNELRNSGSVEKNEYFMDLDKTKN